MLEAIVFYTLAAFIIGFGVLVISLLLFLFRRIVQDKESPHWREETPTMPDAHVAALLEEEMTPA